MTGDAAGAPWGAASPPAQAPAALRDLEAELDPAHPERVDGLRVLAYGEVSAALVLPGLPGWVAKRMSGLTDAAAAERYVNLVRSYLDRLADLGVDTVPTFPVTVDRAGQPPVVYLLQPLVAADRLGHAALAGADDAALGALVDAVLGRVDTVLAGNEAGGLESAVDAQLSNWALTGEAGPDGTPRLALLDVGTPFVRDGDGYRLDVEIFLSAVPPGLRAYYRRKRAVEAYLDDYFDARTVAVDLLGNVHKEGQPERLPVLLDAVNGWLAVHRPGDAAVTAQEVSDYYRADADQLELFLRLRRADRFLRTRVLRGRYDFVLPGAIRR
ncbi:MAG: DUF6206 family protein [Candidatus Nanopelagicales bacterium]